MALKPLLRDLAARALGALGATRPERRVRDRLTVLTFHRVLPELERRHYPFPGLAVTPEELRWYLGWITQHFSCATLADAHRATRAGERGARPWLALTFDDGQLDNYRNAAPLLAEAGVPATFFVPVAHVETGELLWHDRLGFAVAAARPEADARAELRGILAEHGLAPPALAPELVAAAAKGLPETRRRRLVEALVTAFGPGRTPEWAGMMGWSELTELDAAGHEIGSHTMTHPLLPDCEDDRIAAELGDSRRRIESELGSAVESFCYPNGDSNRRVERAVQQAGYQRAVTTAWGSNRRDQDPLALKRCDVRTEHSVDARGRLSGARLAWRLSGLHPGLG